MEAENKPSDVNLPVNHPVVFEKTKRGYRLKGLTIKKKRFVDELFSNGFNISLAYSSVYQSVTKGTAYSNGNRLLKRPEVECEVMARQAAIAKSEQINRSDIIKTLKKIVERYNEDGTGAREAIKALDMLNRMSGQYPKEAAVNNIINNQVEVSFTDSSFDPDFKDPNDSAAINNSQDVEFDTLQEEDEDNEDL
jgi:phage terminase small subunit